MNSGTEKAPTPSLTGMHGTWRQICLAGLILALFSSVRLHAASRFTSVFISEFLADNQHGLTDTDGDHPGWIELYNAGFETVNLAGWFLSDSTTNLAKWRFPEVGILPGAYMVVFASGKNRTKDLVRLHTNFRLATEGGYLALCGPRTNIVSDFEDRYPKQMPDVSYGRVRGEPDLCGFMQEPTPGKPNASSGPGFAPSVQFSRAGGAFVEPFSVELSCTFTGAVIRYTLDGRLPSRRSPRYEGPISITNSTCVRARAYVEEFLPGPPRGETYTLLGSNVIGFDSNLPVLVMDTLGAERSTSSRSSVVQLSFYEPVNGRTRLTNSPSLTTRGGYHIRGSTSAGMPQTPYALQFLNEFNHEQHLPALGMPANSDWVLYAPTEFDSVMIHNPFIHQLSRDMGRYSPRTRFVEVFLARHAGPVQTRDYHGLYVLEEKIKVGKHRVAIDRIGPEDLQPPEVTGGYLVKFDRPGPEESGFWAGGASMIYVEPKEPVISLPQRAEQRQYLSAYFDEFEEVLRSSNWKDPVHGYRAYVDVDSWIDFHVLEVLSGNVDALHFSTYFYKPRNGKITYGPHWDFDRALGSSDYRDSEPRRWNTGRFFHAPWWGRLFTDPDFWQLWVDRWQALRSTTFSEQHMFGLIDRLATEVREAQPREASRWDLQPRWGTYQSEVDWMKNWLTQRTEFIDQQLVQPPKLDRSSGPVSSGTPITLRGPEGATVYYTLDGSDPRAAQGAVSTNALVYSEPIAVQSSVQITARSRNPMQRQVGGPPISTPWSGPVSARYEVQ
ncbi:MAG TPA: CotH kinase family protein [Verrucomicrobiae bacterium]|nr:CotH kinase family protein [Verrucomicrobiae bacterium]